MNNNKTPAVILVVIIAAVVISSYIMYNKLSQQISDLALQLSGLNSRITNIEQNVGSINSDIRRELEKQASILSGHSVEYGEPSADTRMGDITISVTPKECSDSTTATVYLGDISASMIREGVAYKATISSPVEYMYSGFTVSFDNGGTVRSEIVDSNISFDIMYDKIDASFEGSTTQKDNTIIFSGNIHTHYSSAYKDKPAQGLRLIAVDYNDNVIWESTDWASLYEYGFTLSLNRSFTVNDGDSLSFYVEIVDGSGFVLRAFAHGVSNSGGNLLDIDALHSIQIFDRHGNPLEFKYID